MESSGCRQIHEVTGSMESGTANPRKGRRQVRTKRSGGFSAGPEGWHCPWKFYNLSRIVLCVLSCKACKGGGIEPDKQHCEERHTQRATSPQTSGRGKGQSRAKGHL
eukprot:4703274-Amphidinium_carterae.1